MKTTETTEKKKFRLNVVMNVVVWTLICIMFLWSFGGDKERAEIAERTAEARLNALELDRKHENGQDLEIRSHEERLKVLESAVVDLLMANPRPESENVMPAVRQDESASNAEAVSDEDFRAVVLKIAKHKERMAIVKHFKQEDEFKKSLKPDKKRKFDADVEKAYENLLAKCGIDKGSLDKWQEDVFRQGVETAVILE